MNEASTTITYDRVRSGANTIRDCSVVMQNIFEDFGSSIKRVGAEDVFVGDASETLGARFNKLKTSFDDYVKLVETFSVMILGAAEYTEETDKKIASQASNLTV